VPQVRGLISGARAAEGYRTRSVSTVDEISASFADDPPAVDLAVIDARLLGPDGLPVPPDVPVVLTGGAAPPVELDGRADVRVVNEPLSLAELTQTVASLLPSTDSLVPS
jgi:hypothetical protein